MEALASLFRLQFQLVVVLFKLLAHSWNAVRNPKGAAVSIQHFNTLLIMHIPAVTAFCHLVLCR